MNSAEIAGTLRRQITDARFAGGERLPAERLLAERYGVARGTVREALRQLEDAGLVERRAGSGTYVVWRAAQDPVPTVETIRPLELVDARFAVEPHMCRLAVLHATEAELAGLEVHLAEMERDPADIERFADIDEAFHLTLARCSQNPMIVWMMSRIHEVRSHTQWARMRTLTLSPAIIGGYNVEHRAIVDALRERDAERAASAMKAHLATARRSLIGVTG